MKFCPNCGAELEAGARFCTSCGFNLQSAVVVSEQKNNNASVSQSQMRANYNERVQGTTYSINSGFIGSVNEAFRKYFNYKGRMSRANYWWFQLFVTIVAVLIAIVCAVLIGTDSPSFMDLFYTLLIPISLPSISATVRRLHDSNTSGFLVLCSPIPVVGAGIILYFTLRRATEGPNRFG